MAKLFEAKILIVLQVTFSGSFDVDIFPQNVSCAYLASMHAGRATESLKHALRPVPFRARGMVTKMQNF